jgi:chromate transporter
VPFRDAVLVWLRIGLLGFGGPAGQIALMHRILVEERRWIDDARFMHALNYCMLLPGPEAQQLACYVGWLLHRSWGGVVAGALFVAPGFLVVLAFSLLYVGLHDSPWVAALFYGLKPAVIALVLAALLRIGRRALHGWLPLVVAGLAFIAIALFQVPFPAIVAGAALIGLGARRWWPAGAPSPHDAPSPAPMSPIPPVAWHHAVLQAMMWLALWLAPLAGLWLAFGGEHLFTRLASFFAQAALVTFGGAYAVLSYIGQEAVTTHGWLTAGEMVDGLGLAETAPGPLIKVVQFVGFLAAARHVPGMEPWLAGTVAAVLVTWMTFIPSYLFIFAGAPFIERLRGNRVLAAALGAITAAVVGVILHLAWWFALHAIFRGTERVEWGAVQVEVPVWSTIDVMALLLAVAASVAMIRLRLGLVPVLLGCVLLGGAWRLAG